MKVDCSMICVDRRVAGRFSWYGKLSLLTAFLCSLFFVGCFSKYDEGALEAQQNVQPTPPPALEHVIKYNGETLAVIAKWYTGNVENWRYIKQANPNIKPEKMAIGSIIVIPRELVIKEEPLPEKFVRGGVSRSRGNVSKAGSSSRKIRSEDVPPKDVQPKVDDLTKTERALIPVVKEEPQVKKLDPFLSEPLEDAQPVAVGTDAAAPVVSTSQKAEVLDQKAVETLPVFSEERQPVGVSTDLPTSAESKPVPPPTMDADDVRRGELLDELLKE